MLSIRTDIPILVVRDIWTAATQFYLVPVIGSEVCKFTCFIISV